MRGFAIQRLFPSENPAYPILHELGHRAHYWALNDSNRWLAYRTMRLSKEERRIIQREVGFNAARDALEFVADVYAAQIDGRRFTEQIRGLYERFGGPIL
jgi:hypothetical protein